MLAVVYSGRLYYYDGSSWAEVQPAGNYSRNWYSCSIAFDGSSVRMLAGVEGGRLYYYDGSSWSEEQPAGNYNKNWYSCSIAFDGSSVRMLSGYAIGRLYSGFEAGAVTATGNFFLLFN